MSHVLITGANRGIGLALTKQFLKAGHSVWATAREPQSARELKQLEDTSKNKLQVFKLDVTSDQQVQDLAKELKSVTFDFLINNAGVISEDIEKKLEDISLDDLRQTLEVNSLSPVRVTKAFLKHLSQSPHPIVGSLSSLMGSIQDNTSGTYYAYRMSKAALNMFNKSLSIDYPNITAVVLHPGWVQTDMGGPRAPTLPDESAEGLFRVITDLKKSDSGSFIDFKGKRLPW